MKNRRRSQPLISLRNRQLLEHVARYRLSTLDVLQKLFFVDRTRNAVTQVTSRLCRAGLLQRHPLVHPRCYWTLGPQSWHTLGLRALPQPLGPQSLPLDYAVLAYATLAAVPHRRLTAPELRQEYSWLTGALRLAPYCVDESRLARVLELVRVDLGGKPDHVARKCSADVATRNKLPEFSRLLSDQRFRLVVITGTTGKAAAIREALGAHKWPQNLQMHLAVVADLLLLTARKDSTHGT